MSTLLKAEYEWEYEYILMSMFFTGKRCCLLPFLGIIVMVMGECHHGV